MAVNRSGRLRFGLGAGQLRAVGLRALNASRQRQVCCVGVNGLCTVLAPTQTPAAMLPLQATAAKRAERATFRKLRPSKMALIPVQAPHQCSPSIVLFSCARTGSCSAAAPAASAGHVLRMIRGCCAVSCRTTGGVRGSEPGPPAPTPTLASAGAAARDAAAVAEATARYSCTFKVQVEVWS